MTSAICLHILYSLPLSLSSIFLTPLNVLLYQRGNWYNFKFKSLNLYGAAQGICWVAGIQSWVSSFLIKKPQAYTH